MRALWRGASGTPSARLYPPSLPSLIFVPHSITDRCNYQSRPYKHVPATRLLCRCVFFTKRMCPRASSGPLIAPAEEREPCFDPSVAPPPTAISLLGPPCEIQRPRRKRWRRPRRAFLGPLRNCDFLSWRWRSLSESPSRHLRTPPSSTAHRVLSLDSQRIVVCRHHGGRNGRHLHGAWLSRTAVADSATALLDASVLVWEDRSLHPANALPPAPAAVLFVSTAEGRQWQSVV